VAHLDKYWSDQPLLYEFKAELAGTGDRSKCDIEVYLFIYLCICSNMIEYKTILLKQLYTSSTIRLSATASHCCPNYLDTITF